jgi:iron complex transport system substrate-binding protein
MTAKMPLFMLIPLSIVLCAIVIAGCTSVSTSDRKATAYPMAVIDDSGRVMAFDAAPQRIVSLAPSNTEILYALGLQDRIVGVDVNSNYPPEALSKPRMGGMANVSIASVIGAKPDLVLVSQFTPASTVNDLSAAGLKVFCSHPDNASDTERTIITLGSILGVPDSARQLYDNMSAEIAPITEKTSRLNESRKPTVLMIITLDPPMYVADPGNYMDSLITIGGGRNVATGAVMTKEEVLEADPDMIIVPLTDWTQATYDSLKNGSEPWMRGLKAVQNGRVYAVDYDAVGRPGPRMGEGAMLIVGVLHPELFAWGSH